MKNKQLAIRVLQKDCEITGSFYVKGETCAVGRLALEAGVSPRKLASVDEVGVSYRAFGPQDDDYTWKVVKEILAKIKAKFGLSKNQLQVIQSRNDRCDDRETRVKRVVQYVSKL